MKIGENIKKTREQKGLSQKEVVSAIGMGPAQYSRIENGKTDPSVSTLERIAHALGISLGELFANTTESFKEINSYDRTTIEKVNLIEELSEEEKKAVFSIVDAFVSKKKLKSALESVLHEVA